MKFKKISKVKFSGIELTMPPALRLKWNKEGYKRYIINGYSRTGIYLPRYKTFFYI